MMYGNVYVAQVAMGASDVQTVKAFAEAEQYDGPSLIIAYSHCIAHGIKMDLGMDQQRAAVRCGYWPLYRYNPELVERKARVPCSSIRARRRTSSSNTPTTKRAIACSRRPGPPKPGACCERLSKTSSAAGGSWSIWRRFVPSPAANERTRSAAGSTNE